jgi:hypothetical protein
MRFYGSDRYIPTLGTSLYPKPDSSNSRGIKILLKNYFSPIAGFTVTALPFVLKTNDKIWTVTNICTERTDDDQFDRNM